VEPKIRELNLDYLHDLLHVPFTRECFRQYGGPRRHLRLHWEYVAWPWLRRRTLCRVDRHRPARWHRRLPTESEFTACVDCLEELS
jgi:hypothetical protein